MGDWVLNERTMKPLIEANLKRIYRDINGKEIEEFYSYCKYIFEHQDIALRPALIVYSRAVLGKTLKETGDYLGITPERVRQIECKTYQIIKKRFMYRKEQPMTIAREAEIAKEADELRRQALDSLVKLETYSLKLGHELEGEDAELSRKLLDYGISTIDNAIDDVCNGLGFILEEAGYPIKGQL